MIGDRLFSIYWAAWLLLGFGVPEAWALISGHPERTLSEQVWTLEGSGPTIMRYLVAAFCLWLSLHMVFRDFRVFR